MREPSEKPPREAHSRAPVEKWLADSGPILVIRIPRNTSLFLELMEEPDHKSNCFQGPNIVLDDQLRKHAPRSLKASYLDISRISKVVVRTTKCHILCI